jgi:ribosomal protein S21
MPEVQRQPGESLESLLKRFRRELTQSGHLQAYRRRQRYMSKGELRREKIRKALRRMRRRQAQQRKREMMHGEAD